MYDKLENPNSLHEVLSVDCEVLINTVWNKGLKIDG